MKQAHGFQRFSSYVIDFSILFGIYYQLFKVAELFVKPQDLYPPLKGMKLFNPREFDIYFFAIGYGALFCLFYYLITYVFFSATIGQYLLKIRVLKLNGAPLDNWDKKKLVLVALLKFSIVFLPGPLLVLLMVLGHIFSFFALIIALYFLIINPLIAYQKPLKRSWSDLLTKTGVFQI